MSQNTKVVFAIDLTTADGKPRSAGSPGSIPAAEARELIYWGRARLAAGTESPAEKAPARKAAATVADTTNSADPSKADGGESTEGNTP